MNDHELDAALRRVMTPAEENGEAAQRVLTRVQSLPPQKRAFRWWPSALMDWSFAPAWPRVAALAGAAVLGITVGLSNVGTRIATNLDLVQVAAADDASVFDVDSVTGLRP